MIPTYLRCPPRWPRGHPLGRRSGRCPFGGLIAALCLDPGTADRTLRDLLATAATLLGQRADSSPIDIDRYLIQWEAVVTAVVAATTTGHTPAELNDRLDELGGTTDWAALVAALRRVLAGDHDRDHLLAGLDDIDTAILTATLDRFH